MVKDFVDFYGKNIVNESTLIEGVKDFLIWSKKIIFQWRFVQINKNTWP